MEYFPGLDEALVSMNSLSHELCAPPNDSSSTAQPLRYPSRQIIESLLRRCGSRPNPPTLSPLLLPLHPGRRRTLLPTYRLIPLAPNGRIDLRRRRPGCRCRSNNRLWLRRTSWVGVRIVGAAFRENERAGFANQWVLVHVFVAVAEGEIE